MTNPLADTFPLALGTNVFGWNVDEADAARILDAFVDGGARHVDTSDSYPAWVPGNSGGESEQLIGSWLAKNGNRDKVDIATKVSRHPDFTGLAPDNVAAAADASLSRLRTDHIDLYYVHYDDPDRDIEEIADTFNTLVEAGKVRHIGVSNMEPDRIRAWLAASETRGWATPIALQPEYNLLARHNYETQYAPLAEQTGMAVFTYFSLAAGMLTGKYRSAADFDGTDRARHLGKYDNAHAFTTVDTLTEIARETDTTATAVALAWLHHKPTVTAPIASARTTEQLADLLAGARLQLRDDQTARLDAASTAQ